MVIENKFPTTIPFTNGNMTSSDKYVVPYVYVEKNKEMLLVCVHVSFLHLAAVAFSILYDSNR